MSAVHAKPGKSRLPLLWQCYSYALPSVGKPPAVCCSQTWSCMQRTCRLSHLPTTMGFFQPGTRRGMLSITMGSRNTVPFKMLRMVPLGLFHICSQGRGRGGARGAGLAGFSARGMWASTRHRRLPMTSATCKGPAQCTGHCQWPAPRIRPAQHTFFRLNSLTRASSGVMVAHLMPTLCFCGS